MADTVKTTLLKAIAAAVAAVAGTSQVIRNPAMSLTRETAVFPLAFIFDTEATHKVDNRVTLVTVPVWIELWLEEHESTVGDKADSLEADIHKALHAMVVPSVGAFMLRPERSTKFYDDEFTGGVVMDLTLQFRHKTGDPYDPVKT